MPVCLAIDLDHESDDCQHMDTHKIICPFSPRQLGFQLVKALIFERRVHRFTHETRNGAEESHGAILNTRVIATMYLYRTREEYVKDNEDQE